MARMPDLIGEKRRSSMIISSNDLEYFTLAREKRSLVIIPSNRLEYLAYAGDYWK